MAAVFELQKIEGWRFEQPWFGSNYLHFFYPDERGAGQADDTGGYLPATLLPLLPLHLLPLRK